MEGVKQIATTALSELFFETHPRHGRVVFKRALEHASDSSLVALYWKREYNALSRFLHPGIISLLEADLDSSRPWLMFPYLEAVTLRDLLRTDRPRTLSALEFFQILDQLLNALATIHGDHAPSERKTAFLHGDINPRNLLIDAENHVTLIDFALCRPSPASAEEKGFVGPGTPEYMSPGRRRGGGYDCRDDLYAVGVMAAKALGIDFESSDRPFTPKPSAIDMPPAVEVRTIAWIHGMLESPENPEATASGMSWKLAKIIGNL